jgi:hypothetical protein
MASAELGEIGDRFLRRQALDLGLMGVHRMKVLLTMVGS